MNESYRKRISPTLVSPVPRRCSHNPVTLPKRNPFIELPPLKTPGLVEEDQLLKELSQILSKPAVILPPISKKTPSPSFFHKIEPPTRQKVNPLVFDEKFIELNSSLSTCESWTENLKP
jgi:hypothetical protein